MKDNVKLVYALAYFMSWFLILFVIGMARQPVKGKTIKVTFESGRSDTISCTDFIVLNQEERK
jgi:hypothetical protein